MSYGEIYGETHIGNLCNKVYAVILHTCLAYRTRQGGSTLTYISRLGLKKSGDVMQGMMGLSKMHPDDQGWRRCLDDIDCLCVWLHRKFTEEWHQIWRHDEVMALVDDELCVLENAIHVVAENSLRCSMRINKSLIGYALIHRQEILNYIFTFLLCKRVYSRNCSYCEKTCWHVYRWNVEQHTHGDGSD